MTAIEVRTRGSTVRTVCPDTDPTEAWIVVGPGLIAVASPLTSIVALDVSLEVHVTDRVMSDVVPSVYVAVAVNCRLVPWGECGLAGVTAIELIVATSTFRTTIVFELLRASRLDTTACARWRLAGGVARRVTDRKSVV